jgi:DNA primase
VALTPQWLDELRARITLSALIGRTVKITKAGREFKACCPFHNEKSPSFTINDEKGFYHCFGCSAHGDAIRWMTDQRGLSFMDAIKELAAEAGMEVPAADPKAAQRAEKANSLYDVMTAAQAWFVTQLLGVEGSAARGYLKQRGFTEQIIRDFGFGLAPDNRTGLKTALKQFGDPMLIEAGLLISVDGKAPYDRFRGRLMIPIRDPRGRVIAFGGRILGEGEPKYLNSPDTPLFDKGRTLYNLDKCAPASRQTGRVIVVEGYMDVIALAQAGFADAVAPLGTALTEQQLTLLWRLVGDPILCFDGDSAGQKAAIRAAGRAFPLISPGHSVKFVTLPDGQDPDDIIKTQSASGFQHFINRAMPMVDWVWEKELNARPLDTPEQRAALREHLDNLARSIAHEIVRADYMRTWKDKTYKYFADAAREHYLSGRSKGYFSRRIPVSDEARQISETGLSPHYTKALIYTLIVRPWKIASYFEQLVVIASREAPESSMLALLLREELWDRLSREAGSSEPLDVNELDSILAASPELDAIRKLNRSNVLPFSFTNKVFDEYPSGTGGKTTADSQFDQFVKVLVEIPEIDKLVENLSSHARRLGSYSNETQATIQKLLTDKRDYLERLSALGDQPAT